MIRAERYKPGHNQTFVSMSVHLSAPYYGSESMPVTGLTIKIVCTSKDGLNVVVVPYGDDLSVTLCNDKVGVIDAAIIARSELYDWLLKCERKFST